MESTSISYKNIFRVAYPIILGSVAQNVVIITDTAFLGRVGEAELGAAGNGGLLYFIMVLVGMGFAIGTQIIIGRRNGENNYPAIGKVLDNSLLFLFLLAAAFFCFLLFFSEPVIQVLVTSEKVHSGVSDYIRYRSFGIFFGLFNAGINAFFVGITNTRVITFSNIIMAVVNIFLDYAMIFGNFGFPEMGVKGAAMASAFSEVAATMVLLAYLFSTSAHIKYRIFSWASLGLAQLNEILRIATPVMLQHFLAFAAWLVFFSAIERMGVRELAVSHIARSVYLLMILPVIGFSSAACTLVSNLIGEKQHHNVRKVIIRSIHLALLTVLAISPFIFLFPSQLLSVYTKDAGLVRDSIPVLYIITFAMYFLAVSFVAFFSVSGTGNTWISLFIEALSIGVYLLFTYLVAVHWNYPLTVVWCAEFVYFSMLGILSFSYLKFGKWKGARL